MAETFEQAFLDSRIVDEDWLRKKKVEEIESLVDEYFDILLSSGETEEAINNFHRGMPGSISLQRAMGADLGLGIAKLFLPEVLQSLPELYAEIISSIRRIPDFKENPLLIKILKRLFSDVYQN